MARVAVLSAFAAGPQDAGVPPAAAPFPTPGPGCEGWTVRTVARDLGALENIATDGNGALLLSDNAGGRLLRVSPADGSHEVLFSNLAGISGIAVRGRFVYAALAGSWLANLWGRRAGSIVRLDPETGAREVWARQLLMPNGLALFPDGSAVTTRDIYLPTAPQSGITYVPSDRPRKPEPWWSDLDGSNGATLDASGRWLYVTRTFTRRAEVWRVDVADPTWRELIADLGPGLAFTLDDLTLHKGRAYVAATLRGEVLSIDLKTGSWCTLVGGLELPSAVASGPSGISRVADDRRATLYVSSLAGHLYALTAP